MNRIRAIIVEAVNNHHRLKEENERLKYDLDNAKQDLQEGNAIIRQLSEENERLRATLAEVATLESRGVDMKKWIFKALKEAEGEV